MSATLVLLRARPRTLRRWIGAAQKNKLTDRNVSTSISTQSSDSLFQKIIIANRGEIACRVIRTAKKFGIKTVAVFSDADANSKHVELADEAVYIGSSPASESYLVGEKIIAAARQTGAQAVHPGYGFLSENLTFSKLCSDNNIVFIGPPPNAIRAMGSKSESKDIMINAGVPVTPGYHGNDQSNENLWSQAQSIGFPVMLKAVSGGGGKGMRAIWENDRDNFLDALDSCRREAKKSFNDDSMLIERLVQAPRHVELQIFADKYGNAVHLLERDCSVQRRHQKVLEEAPAPNLSSDQREAMGAAAVACAKAVGYEGAGTVEFLVDSITGDFYFCEMNTRLQVEHPVTEMITGLDLVEWQLRVAAGQPLPLTQKEILARSRGCAVEARIYAENPLKDFLPSAGTISHMRVPKGCLEFTLSSVGLDDGGMEAGVRVDAGVRAGDTVSTHYDPMIGKLIAFAHDRTAAIAKLERALRKFQVSGLPNNIDFLVNVTQHPGFLYEQTTTAFFEKYMPEILDRMKKAAAAVEDNGQGGNKLSDHTVLAVVALLESQRKTQPLAKLHTPLRDAWNSIGDDWRLFSEPVCRRLELLGAFSRCPSEPVALTMSTEINGNSYHIFTQPQTGFQKQNSGNQTPTPNATIDPVRARLRSIKMVSKTSPGVQVLEVEAEVDGRLVRGTACLQPPSRKGSSRDRPDPIVTDVWLEGTASAWKTTHGQLTFLSPDYYQASSARSKGVPTLRSPMPGKVIKIAAASGDIVKSGSTLVILEAMKMEHVITAPTEGKVSFYCVEGQSVAEGDKLAEVMN